MLPKHAPKEFQDGSILWNSAEKSEKNSNARTAREVLVALPNELTPEQNIEALRGFIQKNFVDDGMCAGLSIHSGHIHDREDEKYPLEGLTIRKENPHAHIQLTVRPLNDDGTWGAKSKKEYILDRNGNKIKLPSGEWKSRKISTTDWDKPETLKKWRENWAATINKKFEELAISERIDHRTLKAQGIDREPTKHIGVVAWNLAKKGIETEQLKEHREIIARNMGREIEKMKHKKAEIAERAKNINAMSGQLTELRETRAKMGFFRSKKAINEQIKQLENTHEAARNSFMRDYQFAPAFAVAELKTLEIKIKSAERTHAQLQNKISSFIQQKHQKEQAITKPNSQKLETQSNTAEHQREKQPETQRNQATTAEPSADRDRDRQREQEISKRRELRNYQRKYYSNEKDRDFERSR